MTDPHAKRRHALDLGAELAVDRPQAAGRRRSRHARARHLPSFVDQQPRARPPVNGSNCVRFRCTPNEHFANFETASAASRVAGAFAMIVAEEIRPSRNEVERGFVHLPAHPQVVGVDDDGTARH